MSTKHIFGAGFIIFRRSSDNAIEYLMLQHVKDGHLTPPKGHMDHGESEFETALRETREECGLHIMRDFKLINQDFTIKANYIKKGLPKQVTFWLAEVVDAHNVPIKLSREHSGYKWMRLEEALDAVQDISDMSNVLRQANDYLLRLKGKT